MSKPGHATAYAIPVVAFGVVITLTACRLSPTCHPTSFTLTADVPSAVEGLPTSRPSTPHTITLDVRTYDPSTDADVSNHTVFELPSVRCHFLGPRFTVQVQAEQETRFTVRAPGYTPIDKIMVPQY